jgi:nucleotide-binding universal stress UspA family protein
MFERILLPLDGSELAEASIPYAEEIAGSLGSEIILYHVFGHEYKHQQHMHQTYLDRLVDSIRQNAKKGGANGNEVKVTTEIEAGEPAGSICNLVDKNKVDLIIMAAVSASGLKIGKMLGSVTDHLCRTVPIPVLIIRPQDIARIESKKQLISHILLPQDGSEPGKLALPVGEELAARLKVPVTLFQMATMVLIYDYGYGMGYAGYVDYGKVDEYEKKRVDEGILELEDKLKLKGLDVTHRVTSGTDAAGEIMKAGKDVGADLIVMSTHGRSGFDRWALGSVTERVLRYGEMPLLLVNARAG